MTGPDRLAFVDLLGRGEARLDVPVRRELHRVEEVDQLASRDERRPVAERVGGLRRLVSLAQRARAVDEPAEEAAVGGEDPTSLDERPVELVDEADRGDQQGGVERAVAKRQSSSHGADDPDASVASECKHRVCGVLPHVETEGFGESTRPDADLEAYPWVTDEPREGLELCVTHRIVTLEPSIVSVGLNLEWGVGGHVITFRAVASEVGGHGSGGFPCQRRGPTLASDHTRVTDPASADRTQ